jgi:hypothetical protein
VIGENVPFVQPKPQDFVIFLSVLFIFIGWNEIESTVNGPLYSMLYQPRMKNGDECGAISGLFVRGNWSAGRKIALMQVYTSRISNDVIWGWNITVFQGFINCK